MPNLRAPSAYWELTTEQKAEIVNGCGPAGWRFDLVPDSLCGLDISEACNIHDFMYWQGKDKEEADRTLAHNILEVCLDGSHALLPLRCGEMSLFYLAVHKSGGEYFGGGKK